MHAVVSLVVFAGLSAVFVGLIWQPQVHAETAVEHEAGDECCPPANAGPSEGAEPADECTSHGVAGAPCLNDLKKVRCEHAATIIDCDECRYEVGVAKISPEIAKGLVEAWPVRTESQATKRLSLTGEVQLDLTRVVEIASVGAGRVEQVSKNLGDRVEADDMVAIVQSSEFGEAQAAFLEARARLDLARQTSEREKQLHERQISSQADYLAARSELASAEASVAAGRKRLQLFGLSDDRIETLVTADSDAGFGQLALTSPIAGTVIEQNVVRGQLVSTSDKLYRIADLSRVWVWCDLYESDLAVLHDRIASGAAVQAEVHAGAFPQTVFHGTIDMIGSQLDRETRTVKARVIVDNRDGRLKPGMFVRVAVGLDGERPVVRVPATAVLSDAGTQFVFARLSEDLWIRRDVTTGPAEAGLVEVRRGLNDGDIVAAKGAFMFKSEVLKEKMGAGCAH
jgi:cobalt-zinc-cadmium efflux system membrane fusion protein